MKDLFYYSIFAVILYFVLTAIFDNFTLEQENFDPSLVPVSSIITLAKVAQKLVNGNGTLTNPGNLQIGSSASAPGNLTVTGNANINGNTNINGTLFVGNENIVKIITDRVSTLDTSLNNRVSTLDTSLNNRVSTLDSSLNNRVTAIDTSLNNKATTLDNTLNSKVNAIDSSLNNKVTTLENSLKSKATELASSFTTNTLEVTSNSSLNTLSTNTISMKNMVAIGLNIKSGTASPDATIISYGDGSGWRTRFGYNSGSSFVSGMDVYDNGNVNIAKNLSFKPVICPVSAWDSNVFLQTAKPYFNSAPDGTAMLFLFTMDANSYSSPRYVIKYRGKLSSYALDYGQALTITI